MDPIERKNFLRSVGEQVAPRLGDGWSLHPNNGEYNDEYRELHGPNGQALYFAFKDDTKLTFGPRWPKDETGRESFPRGYQNEPKVEGIKVSIEKTPEIIARDIQRRLLPQYQATLAAIQKRLEESSSYEKKRAANLERLAKVVGTTVRYDRNGQAPHSISHYRNDGPYAREIYTNDTTADINLSSVPMKLAVEILALIANYGKKVENEAA